MDPAIHAAHKFSQEVLRLRAEYEQRRLATNLFPPQLAGCVTN
jgi:hypothetical protein